MSKENVKTWKQLTKMQENDHGEILPFFEKKYDAK